MFFCLVQVNLLPISSISIELSSGDFVETSNQTATQRPEVSLENTAVEVEEETEKDEGEARDESDIRGNSSVLVMFFSMWRASHVGHVTRFLSSNTRI